MDTAGDEDEEEWRRKEEKAKGREANGWKEKQKEERNEGQKEGSLPEPNCTFATEVSEDEAEQRLMQLGSNVSNGVNAARCLTRVECS